MAKVFVITGPSGVGKGTLIRAAARAGPRARALDLGDHPGAARGRGGRARLPLPRPRASSPRGPTRNEFLEHAAYSGNRYGTLRSEVERRLAAGESVVLEIEVQGARQVRAAMPEAVLVFIAPPDPRRCASGSRAAAPTIAEAISERLRTAEIELDAQQEFQHVVVNDELERAAEELERIVRAELARQERRPLVPTLAAR